MVLDHDRMRVCFAPVLSMAEAPLHPHMKARSTFVEHDGVVQPAPAPRFSRTKPEIRRSAGSEEPPAEDVLREWGLTVCRRWRSYALPVPSADTNNGMNRA
jgi:alpha-methylacyl-CoA racemase